MTVGRRVAFVGAGNMTEALVAGMLKAGLVSPEQLHATDVVVSRRDHMRSHYGIGTGSDNREAAGWGEVIVVSVEPRDLDAVLDEIRPKLASACILVSVAAGYPISRIVARLKSDCQVVRAMPNTPSSIGAGMTALAFSVNASDSTRRLATEMFTAVGRVIEVEESLMDAVTGVSGSGPAYIYLMIEALADGGVRMGLPRQTASLLAAQTVLGTAKLLLETGEHPGRLKDRVASPAGTTIAGIERLEAGRFRAALMSAVEAAVSRARELGLS